MDKIEVNNISFNKFSDKEVFENLANESTVTNLLNPPTEVQSSPRRSCRIKTLTNKIKDVDFVSTENSDLNVENDKNYCVLGYVICQMC